MWQIRADLAELRRDLDQQHDETVVVNRMVMRYVGEHIAWGGMENQLRELSARIEAIWSKT